MAKPPHDEEYFAEGIRNRSYSVFEALFRRYYPDLFRFAYAYMMNRQSAEDVVQDVFASLWTNAGSIPREIKLDRYIYSSVKNACLDYLKHLRVCDANHDKLTEALVFSASVRYDEDPALLERVRTCLVQLPEQQRKVLELKIEKNLNYREIGEELGLSEQTVHTHVKRAYSSLRKNMPIVFMLMRVWGVI